MENPSARHATIPVSVHLTPQIKSALSAIARREARTLSGQLRKLAEDFLAEKSASAA
jgi:hypothetical protein